MLDEFFSKGLNRRRAPTVYWQARQVLNIQEQPKKVKRIMWMMIFFEASLLLVPIFIELETAIFSICFVQYFIISCLLVFGYIKVFFGLVSLLLIQYESALVPPSQKKEVKRMTFLIGILFLLIIQRNAMEIVAFTKFNIDGVHMPIVFRSSETYSVLSFLSIAALFFSNLISLSMVMSSHYQSANAELRHSSKIDDEQRSS